MTRAAKRSPGTIDDVPDPTPSDPRHPRSAPARQDAAVGSSETPEPRRPSIAPVVVVAGFMVVAITLVLIGAQRSAAPPPTVVIDRPGTAASPRPVVVLMRDFLFDPTPFVLVAGETVAITVIDAGLEPHEMVLGDASVQAAWSAANAAATPPAPFATRPPPSVGPDVGGVRVWLDTGQRETVIYEVPTTGDLQLLCHIPGHIERGMIGRVELRTSLEGGSSDAS